MSFNGFEHINKWETRKLPGNLKASRVPGAALQGALEHVGEAIKTCSEYFLELVMQIISSFISLVFDHLKEAATGSAALTGSAVGGLVEKTRDSLDGLLKDLPEVIDSLSETLMTIVTDLWNNYKDALSYFTEKA